MSEEERTKQEMFDFLQNETVKYAKINSSKEIDVEKSPTTMDTIKKILTMQASLLMVFLMPLVHC